MRFFKLMTQNLTARPLVTATATSVLSPEAVAERNYEALKTSALAHERRRVEPHQGA